MSRFSRGEAPAPEGYGYRALAALVRTTLDAGVSVLVTGHPGVGKSALAAEVAADMGLPLVDLRLAQREPAELCGVYFPDRDAQSLQLLAPPWAAAVCDAPALLFLDEINAAVTRLHQAAAFQLVLERRVGPRCLHPGTRVLAAGNLLEDGPVVSPLASALRNRFAHFRLRVCVEDWLAWAEDAEVAPVIVAYMRAHPHRAEGLLYDPSDDNAFPSPRTWAMAGRLYARGAPEARRRLVAACVGVKAAEAFFNFLALYGRLDPVKVIADGRVVDFTRGRNSDPSFAHAAVWAIVDWVKAQPAFEPAWSEGMTRFLEAPGLDPEHAVVLLRAVAERPDVRGALDAHPRFRAFAGELVQTMVGFDAL